MIPWEIPDSVMLEIQHRAVLIKGTVYDGWTLVEQLYAEVMGWA